jgi:branched-chain amino acid transport system substrate-binding protein
MSLGRRAHFAAGLLAALPLLAQADISGGVVRIGVLTDLSSIYSDYSGQNSITAVKLAVEDAGGKVNGKPIEIVSADFLNKPDVSLSIARKWIDRDGVDVIVDAANSTVAIALQGLVREKDKVFLMGAFSSDLTGKYCTPNGVQFQPDSYSVATVLGQALVARGMRSWYSVGPDYAMGQAVERDLTAAVKAQGGSMAGAVRHPFGAGDMSSFVLQAEASHAEILSLNSSGADLQNLFKTVNEYGLNKKMKLTSPGIELLDSYRLGRKVLAGTFVADTWYWDLNPETRAFAKRYAAAHPKHYYPSRSQAALYSMTTAYLRAVQALDDDQRGKAVVDRMKASPIDDVYAKGAVVRADGRLIIDMHLFEVKSDGEPSQNAWDLYKDVATVPGEKAFVPVAQSECAAFR